MMKPTGTRLPNPIGFHAPRSRSLDQGAMHFDHNESLEQALQRNVRDALMEDIGRADWTAQLVPADRRARAHVVAKSQR